ncbi:TetR/AcrR family transcriptional regulator [Mitsuaria sp. GD03876]|uniref:TetR/AcrR family transcriptional regulator n=1 Tax=Mitsuaria sp. GD03876 TaxID=2975399 RepID=UPI002449EECD|nr:TetR/AcrR family transcriptional regulator [Mitsuaria sp. GD03876]MDH0866538.1 TetR/AcrR family transcriptional regulator [Mitsuaria sp. GD03876]
MAAKKSATPLDGGGNGDGTGVEKLDERVRRSRETVLKTASALLAELGVSGLTVDEVSRRSGVAKTTIYRHWRTRTELVVEACHHLGTPQQTPDLGSLTADLTALLLDLAHLLGTAAWASVLPSMVDAGERNPELAALQSRAQAGHAGPFLAVIERARLKGEIAADTDAPAMVAALVGPLFYRRWFSREAIDARFVGQVVSGAIHGASPLRP